MKLTNSEESMSNYFRGKIDEMRKLEIKKDFLAGGVKCKLDGIVDFTAKFVQNHQLFFANCTKISDIA